MSFSNSNAGRVSQSTYWLFFGINLLAVPALLIGGVVAMAGGGFLLGILMILAIFPLGIYWRVIMMRRCRDIGWPAMLPWLLFGGQIVASWSMPMTPGATPEAALSSLGFVLGLAVVDFVFSIVIGCIGSKRDVNYADVFGDGPETFQRTRPAGAMSAPSDGSDRFDAAIARALEAHRRGESQVSAPASPPSAPAIPGGRPVAGFGRRVI